MSRQSLRRQSSGAAIGARLRRLSERIDREATAAYARRGIAFEQRWYGPMALLDTRGPLSVTEIARALGISHAAVSQVRRSLSAAGLVESVPDEADGRRSILSLSVAGSALVRRLWPLWDAINQAGDTLNREAGDVAAALDRLEGALNRQSLSARIDAVVIGIGS